MRQQFSLRVMIWSCSVILIAVGLTVWPKHLFQPSVVRAAPVAVTIIEYAYQPNPLTVNVGDTVTWTNNGGSIHDVTSFDGLFSSGDLVPNNPARKTFTFTFTQAGTYVYTCTHHNGMDASVLVIGGPTITPTATRTATPSPTITQVPTATQIPSAPTYAYRMFLPGINR